MLTRDYILEYLVKMSLDDAAIHFTLTFLKDLTFT